MKKILFVGSLFSSLFGYAQEEPKTLLGTNGIKSWGLTAGGGFQNTQLFDESVWFAHVQAGVILNQSWTIGGHFGQSLHYISPIYTDNTSLPVYRDFEFKHYGGFIEYRVMPNKLVHLAFPLKLGVFEQDFDTQNAVFSDSDDAERFNLFVEPGINLELNLHKHVRLHTGVSYRILVSELYNEVNLQNTNNHFIWNFGVKFGIFNLK
jgi:hypothetical protein